MSETVFEICYKDDSLGDPIINDDHAVIVLKAISRDQLAQVKEMSLKINQILKEVFANINIKLVDFKLEFGFDSDKNILLADEISPDSCRLWDVNSSEKLDKDRFRRNLGGLVEAYKEVATRLGIKI